MLSSFFWTIALWNFSRVLWFACHVYVPGPIHGRQTTPIIRTVGSTYFKIAPIHWILAEPIAGEIPRVSSLTDLGWKAGGFRFCPVFVCDLSYHCERSLSTQVYRVRFTAALLLLLVCCYYLAVDLSSRKCQLVQLFITQWQSNKRKPSARDQLWWINTIQLFSWWPPSHQPKRKTRPCTKSCTVPVFIVVYD